MALNRLTLSESEPGDRALEIGHSFAWRPGTSVWFDLNRRSAVNVSSGYLVTRPRLTLREGDDLARRTLRADALIVRAGVACKVF